MIVLKNNQFIEREYATIDMEDRGHQFGDGVYEVIRVYEGRYFLLQDHLERLQYSLNETGINFNISEENVHDHLHQLIDLNDVEDGAIYIQITRGIAPRSHPFPKDTSPMVFAYPIKATSPTEAQSKGIKVILEEDFRWLRCDIKSLNLLGNVMTKQKAVEAGATEAIFYRDENHVTEGSSTNVFIVKDGTIYTHPADNYILNGINRRYLLYLAKELNIPYKETIFSINDLKQADEVFISSTTSEMLPVVNVDGEPVANNKPGPISKQLLETFFKYKDLNQIPTH
ncbi:D-amino-acid transaminase [Alkalibacillus aidingensis]|uniref:D-amino-acid transaminase n=1 Tax=Alkalibacillus aidingensis TaxID=2747607 RepID=UPI001660F2DD|nr:D-amino-acid transaminase [Alkalibacillus aidingensis]